MGCGLSASLAANDTKGREEVSSEGFFDVWVTREDAQPLALGATVASDGQQDIVVTAVHAEGLIPRWNAVCSQEQHVQIGDRFVEVNRVRQDGDKMKRILMEQRDLHIRVKKALPSVIGDFEVRLQKPGSSELGLRLEPGSKTFLKDGKEIVHNHLSVLSVKQGLASDWNTVCPFDKQISAGDLIVDVNGVSSSTDFMFEAIKHAVVVVLNIKRTESRLQAAAALVTPRGLDAAMPSPRVPPQQPSSNQVQPVTAEAVPAVQRKDVPAVVDMRAFEEVSTRSVQPGDELVSEGRSKSEGCGWNCLSS
eukprot:TRINITY_DN18992_c0_g2_i1.p1 TRINITY_DN18992_c0_g2~~TRINITY_DN18992_c0_g2_i1.p1  ORF type:complete len:307 (-),score=57.45 TRINITY_DN18992_c0_g2_i1:273-1193(-)